MFQRSALPGAFSCLTQRCPNKCSRVPQDTRKQEHLIGWHVPSATVAPSYNSSTDKVVRTLHEGFFFQFFQLQAGWTGCRAITLDCSSILTSSNEVIGVDPNHARCISQVRCQVNAELLRNKSRSRWPSSKAGPAICVAD